MTRYLFATGFALNLLLMSGAGRCDVLSFNFTGRVNLVFGVPFYGISPIVGDSVVGEFTFDTTFSDPTPFPTGRRSYLQPFPNRFGFTLRGVTMASDAGYSMSVEDSPSGDVFDIADLGPIDVNGTVQQGTIQFHLFDNTGTAFTNVGIPMELHLASFASNFGEISTVSDGQSSGVVFSITSLTQVPEPRTLSLLVGGTLPGALWLLWRIISVRRRGLKSVMAPPARGTIAGKERLNDWGHL